MSEQTDVLERVLERQAGRYWPLDADVLQGEEATAMLIARAADVVNAQHISKLLEHYRAKPCSASRTAQIWAVT